jgi:hypothetical protein
MYLSEFISRPHRRRWGLPHGTSKRVAALRSRSRWGKLLMLGTKGLQLDAKAIKATGHYDGEFLVHGNDDTLSAEDKADALRRAEPGATRRARWKRARCSIGRRTASTRTWPSRCCHCRWSAPSSTPAGHLAQCARPADVVEALTALSGFASRLIQRPPRHPEKFREDFRPMIIVQTFVRGGTRPHSLPSRGAMRVRSSPAGEARSEPCSPAAQVRLKPIGSAALRSGPAFAFERAMQGDLRTARVAK